MTGGWATICAFDGYSTALLAAWAQVGLERLVAKRLTPHADRGSGQRIA